MSDHVNLGYNPLMPPSIRIDSSILEAALIGYKHGRNGDRRQDGSDPPSDRQRDSASDTASDVSAEAPAKRTLSPAARKRIAAAQRKQRAAGAAYRRVSFLTIP